MKNRASYVALTCIASLLGAAPLATGCGGYIVVDSHEEIVQGPARTLESEMLYSVKRVSLADNELQIVLDRQCNEVREIETYTRVTEHREYRTAGLWWTAAGVASGALVFGLPIYLMSTFDKCDPVFEFDGSCEGQEDEGSGFETAGLATTFGFLGVALIIAGVATYYEVADHDIERVMDKQVRREASSQACSEPWPIGRAELKAAHANAKFEGHSSGDGRVTIPVGGASRNTWVGDEPLELELPNTLDWVQIHLPTSVRTALLNDNAETAERVYVWYEVEDKYRDLLKAGTERVQGRMTNSRRYQFLSDDATRSTIDKAVARSGGSADSRRKSAIEAAQSENIKKVVQISITPIFETQVQLSLAVFNTSTGDQIYATQQAADLKNAAEAVDIFSQLAEAYLAWEKQ